MKYHIFRGLPLILVLALLTVAFCSCAGPMPSSDRNDRYATPAAESIYK